MHSQENGTPPPAERQVPWDNDAEQAVLAAMLLDAAAIAQAQTILDDTMFYREAHRVLFTKMVALHAGGSAVDPVTLRAVLNGDLDRIGGMEYIGGLIDVVPTAANVTYHAAIVRKHALRRRTIEAATTVIEDAFAGRPLGDAVHRLHQLDQALSPTRARRRSLSDVAILTQPDPTCLIAGLLPAGAPGEAQAFTYLVGRNGAGKTFLLLDWAMHIAAGLPWQGRAVRQGPVLYVYGEGTMKRRVAAWRAAHRVPDGDPVGVTFVPGIVNLLDARDVQAFIAEIQRGDHGSLPVLIILETFTRMTPGGKENDPETHSRVLDSTGLLQRELGAAVTVSAHTPWATDNQRWRGHSITPDAADAGYLLENPDNGGALRLSSLKNREDAWAPVIALKLTRQDASLVIDADATAPAAIGPTGRTGKSAQTRATILTAMADGATWGIAGLMAATGLAKDSIRNHLQALEAAGRVIVTIPGGKKGSPKGWRVAGDSAMGRFSLREREIATSQSPNPAQATGFGDRAESGENRRIAESPNLRDGSEGITGRGDAYEPEAG